MKNFSLNSLTETRFEEFCFDMLVELGFTNVGGEKVLVFQVAPPIAVATSSVNANSLT